MSKLEYKFLGFIASALAVLGYVIHVIKLS